MIFFIKKPDLTKKNSGHWEGRGCGEARVFFFLFSKESKSEKKCFLFEGVKAKGGLASVSKFVL